MFAPDAVADYRNGGTTRMLRGREEIIAFFADANASSAHHISSSYVTELEGTVRATTKFLVAYTLPHHYPHRWYGGD